jgi:hypothetical protein
MMRGAILKILAGSALAVAATAANAAVNISAGSTMSVSGPNNLVTPGTASQATAIDFLTWNGTSYVGGAAAGTVTGYVGTGSFSGESCAGNLCGTINDINPLSVGTSVSPLFSLLDGLTFTLTSITSVDRSNPALIGFTGTGTFGGMLNGQAVNATAGSIVYSSQGGGTTTFSALTTALPEPGTWAMMLLGFGGIGLAMRRRRRPVLAQVA